VNSWECDWWGTAEGLCRYEGGPEEEGGDKEGERAASLVDDCGDDSNGTRVESSSRVRGVAAANGDGDGGDANGDGDGDGDGSGGGSSTWHRQHDSTAQHDDIDEGDRGGASLDGGVAAGVSLCSGCQLSASYPTSGGGGDDDNDADGDDDGNSRDAVVEPEAVLFLCRWIAAAAPPEDRGEVSEPPCPLCNCAAWELPMSMYTPAPPSAGTHTCRRAGGGVSLVNGTAAGSSLVSGGQLSATHPISSGGGGFTHTHMHARGAAGDRDCTPVLHTRGSVAPELGDAGVVDAFDGQLFVCEPGAHVWGWRRQKGGGTLLYSVNPVSAVS
jgi:hypothetical protein